MEDFQKNSQGVHGNFAGFICSCFSMISFKRGDDHSKILRKITLRKSPDCP